MLNHWQIDDIAEFLRDHTGLAIDTDVRDYCCGHGNCYEPAILLVEKKDGSMAGLCTVHIRTLFIAYHLEFPVRAVSI